MTRSTTSTCSSLSHLFSSLGFGTSTVYHHALIHLRVVGGRSCDERWRRTLARADEAAAHSSLACCHLSARFFIRFKEPKLFYFYPPAAPRNRQRIDDGIHVSDTRQLAPGAPPPVATSSLTLLPPHFRSRSTSCFSPFSTHSYSIFP